MTQTNPALILASSSAARQAMLRNAGLDFQVIPAAIDEAPLMQAHHNDPYRAVRELARAKALAVAALHPNALVIGADQVAVFEGEIFSKAPNAQAALDRLQAMSGKAHSLVSGVSIAKGATLFWEAQDEAHLTFRTFTPDFLKNYAQAAGESLVACAGGYALEGAGSWLFSEIKGDHFTILGLPLLPLLCYLQDYQEFKP